MVAWGERGKEVRGYVEEKGGGGEREGKMRLKRLGCVEREVRVREEEKRREKGREEKRREEGKRLGCGKREERERGKDEVERLG